MECQCEREVPEDAGPGWWLSGGNVQMGAFTLVGYLLYRFSQTLPALVRWPVRIFCSLTGLSALWGWVSRLVGTIRGIQTLVKWLSRIWKFIVGLSRSKRLAAVTRAITGCSSEGTFECNSKAKEEGLRMVLLGPAGAGRALLADTLLDTWTEQVGPLMESTQRRKAIDGIEITLVDTPDLLGTSLANGRRATEALRSIQLTRPGPHAFLLVVPAPGSHRGPNRDVAQQIQTTIQLFGDMAAGYILPVFTHAGHLPRGRQTLDQLLGANAALAAAVALCRQRPELVDNRPDGPAGARSGTRRQLLARVAEMSALGGHFVHSLQRKEDLMREALLADTSSTLAAQLGGE